MPVTEVKQALGSFAVALRPTTPREVLDALTYLGHIAIVEGRLNPAEYGDELLAAARYVGVYRNRQNDVDNRTHNVDGIYRLQGVGMPFWLGDENGKGAVIEAAISSSGQPFASMIRSLLPDSVAEGTLHSVPGIYVGSHQWVTPRQAIQYVCEVFGAEWRVNGDGSLDAGTIAQLYPPRAEAAMLVKHGYGRDLTFTAYKGKIDSAEDVEEFSTRVVVLAEGQGESIAKGTANISFNPYRDLFGNPVQLTRVVSESSTTAGNAAARAQIELAAVSTTRRSLRLAASDYDVAGTVAVGEYVWVYDPDTGLVNTDNEVEFRNQRINPARFRCVEMTWPITSDMTVAYRGPTGAWIDLTDYVRFEDRGDVSLTIGELPRSLSGGGGEPIGTRPSDDLSTPDTPTWNLPFFTSSYLDGLGNTRAQVLLAWHTPLNTDGSTVLDGLHYEIQYGLNPATDWTSVYAAWDATTTLIQDLSPGLGYDIRIRAADRYGHISAWSPTEQIIVSPDTIPPSTPAEPVVAGSLIAIQVVHELGQAAGGTFNLEADLDHLEIHVGATAVFTPDASTLVGKLPANVGMMLAQVAAVGTFQVTATTARWVKVIAVDASGNASSPSTAATATAQLIDDAHISTLTVSKITAGTLGANVVLGASIRTANSGARVELNSTGVHGFNSGGLETVSLLNDGTFTLRSASTGARAEFSTGGVGLWNSSGVQTVSLAAANGVFFMRSGTSGARVDLSTVSGLQLYNSGGVNTVALDPNGSFVLRSGTSGSRIELDTNGFRAYNSSSVQTVNIESNGNATIQGEVRSAVSGRRIVVNPAGSTDPQIKFYPSSGTNETILSAPPSATNEAELSIVTGVGTNSRRGKLFLGSGFCYLQNGLGGAVADSIITLTEFGRVSITGANIDLSSYTTDTSLFANRDMFLSSVNDMVLQGDEVILQSNGISFRGRVSPANVNSAVVCGKANVSGTGGTIFYGPTYSGGVPYPAAQVRAGNNGAFNITNGAPGNFGWVWGGASLNAGFDHINWFGRIE